MEFVEGEINFADSIDSLVRCFIAIKDNIAMKRKITIAAFFTFIRHGDLQKITNSMDD